MQPGGDGGKRRGVEWCSHRMGCCPGGQGEPVSLNPFPDSCHPQGANRRVGAGPQPPGWVSGAAPQPILAPLRAALLPMASSS